MSIIIAGVAFLFLFQHFLAPKEWKTYENARYQFSLRYHPDWQLGEEETNNAGRTFLSPDEKVRCYAYGFANVLLNEEGQSQSLEEFIDWLLETDPDSTEVLEREKDELGGREAVYLFTEKEDSVWEAVYTLNEEEGAGLYCTYSDMREKKQYDVFEKMKESFAFDETEVVFSGEECSLLLDGVVEPLKDMVSFLDRDYIEVTLVARKNWDPARLPEQVLTLENEGYTCYPMPYDVIDTKSGGNIHAQPEVTSVEWTCEKQYENYHYLSEEELELVDSYRAEGYDCRKEECFEENGEVGFVWFCAK